LHRFERCLFALATAERMMPMSAAFKSLWWLIHKDVTRELRAHHVWPGMLLLGLVLVFLVAAQVDLPPAQLAHVAGGLVWLAIFFAGTLALERSLAGERDAGCWQTLMLYPVAPSVLFASKLAVNLAALVFLECVLVPAFIVLTDVPIAARPSQLALIAALGNIGFAALGTLVSALTAGLRHRGGLLALLLLPLVTPILLGSAEATSLSLAGEFDPLGWRWVHFLAGCAVAFTTLGAVAFEFVLEE
jgi:heme exporter protein B